MPLKKIANTLFIIGVILVAGTAGASDLGTISLTRTVVQCLIAMACIGVAWVIYKYKEVE